MINLNKHIKACLLVSFLTAATPALHAQDMVKDAAQDGLMKTVSYNVSSFTDLRDKKLQDVMMKMPGLNGTDFSGSVFFTYNGMDVGKIYVNGMDVLEGNNQPVFNLKPEDVERIEITENQVAIHIMRGKQYSNTASINVVLKDSASGKWSGSLKAMAGGPPLLGSLDFNGLNLGPKVQTTIMLKGDNTGLDYSGPLHGYGDYGSMYGDYSTDSYTEDSYAGLEGVSGSFDYMLRKIINAEPNLAPLSPERVRFNRSSVAQVSSTFKLSDDYQLNVQATLHGSRLTANAFDETTYFNCTEGTKLSKLDDTKAHQYDWQSSATLLSNTESQFLRNQLSFHHRRIDMTKDLTGSPLDYYDMLTTPLYLKNDFHVKRLVGDHVLSVNAMAGYTTRNQYVDMDGVKTIAQDLKLSSGFVDLGAKLDFFLGHGLHLSLNAGGAWNDRNMKAQIEGEEMPQRAKNDTQILNLFGGAAMTWITDKMQAELSVPVVYGHYTQDYTSFYGVGERIQAQDSLLTISPKLNVKYDFTPRFSVSAQISMNQQGPDRKRLYYGSYLKDTQTIETGYENQIYKDKTWEFTTNATYRNPEKAFFANGMLGYWVGNNPYMTNRLFRDLFVVNQYIGVPDTPQGKTFLISGDVNKGIAFLRGKIGVSAEIMNDKTFLLLQADPLMHMQTDMKTWSVSPYVNGKLLNWCNMIYKLNFQNFNMKMGEMNSQTHSVTQTMELIFSPWEKLNFSLLGEHYYTEFSENESKNLVLADFKAEYSLNDRWQLLLTATNILNQDTYNYTLVDSENYSHSFTSYNIRPRNILLGVFYKF